MTLVEARKRMRQRNYFGTMMVETGDADGLISGLTQSYPETIRPALQIIGTRPGVRRVSRRLRPDPPATACSSSPTPR